MTLFTALSAECIEAGASLSDKPSALRLVAKLAKASPASEGVSEAEIFAGLEQRESLGSTGFGGGIAIPHCRLDGVADFVVGLVSIPDGVDFDAMDGLAVRLIVFIVGPERESKEHIHLLSGISQTLSIPGVVDELIAARTSDALRESFLRHVRDELEAEGENGRNLFHVIVQDEDLFQDILQVFGSIESTGAVILNAENTGVYLSRIPLFADIWSDNAKRFSQLIVALVNKRITNETIRRIERITGPLKGRSDVMVVVQDVFYCAGAIDD